MDSFAEQTNAKTLVILPTYNEADNVPALCEALLSLPAKLDLLFVDDGSPDGTANVVRSQSEFNRRIFLLERREKMGLGSAYRAGFQWALRREYTVCIQMDSDLSHDPDDVPRLLQALQGNIDVAVGTRYMTGGGVRNWPWHRLLLSRAAGLYTRLWTGMSMADPTSGFKAISRDALESVGIQNLTSEGYGFQIELHYRLQQTGHRIQEIPILFTERRQGRSKMSTQVALEAILKVPLLPWRHRSRRVKPVESRSPQVAGEPTA